MNQKGVRKVKGKLLVIDDELSMREVLSIMLTKENYEVLSAADGEEGIRLVREAQPRVVLVDIRLPGINGLQVLSEIRRMDPQIPVIMVTAISDLKVAREAEKKGAFGYIVKPFTFWEIKSVIQEAEKQIPGGSDKIFP